MPTFPFHTVLKSCTIGIKQIESYCISVKENIAMPNSPSLSSLRVLRLNKLQSVENPYFTQENLEAKHLLKENSVLKLGSYYKYVVTEDGRVFYGDRAQKYGLSGETGKNLFHGNLAANGEIKVVYAGGFWAAPRNIVLDNCSYGYKPPKDKAELITEWFKETFREHEKIKNSQTGALEDHGTAEQQASRIGRNPRITADALAQMEAKKLTANLPEKRKITRGSR
jgi:hypothetical protein